MGQTFVGIRATDKSIGLVEKGDRKNPWLVQWKDTEELEPIGVRDVCILGSPKFYLKLDDSINKKHFDENPKYFLDALLAQEAPFALVDPTKIVEGQEPQAKASPDALSIKKRLVAANVTSAEELKTLWSDLEKKYTDKDKVRFVVKNPENFKFTVEMPWKAEMLSKPKTKAPSASKPKAADAVAVGESSMAELLLASQGQKMGADFEARALDPWTYISHISDFGLSSKDFKLFEDKGSDSAKLIISALQVLAGFKKVSDPEKLWKALQIAPTVDQRQYEGILQYVVRNSITLRNPKEFLKFLVDESLDSDKFLASPSKLLASVAANIVSTNTELFDSLSEKHVETLIERCTWDSGNKQALLAKLVRRNKGYVKAKDIFFGIDLDSLLALPGSELARILSDRNELAAATKPHVERLIKNSGNSDELFGLIRFGSQVIGSIDLGTLELATEKAFKGQTVFEQAWENLSGKATLVELQKEVDQAAKQLEIALQELKKTESTANEARRYAEQLNAQLTKAMDATNLNFDANANAAKLDAARAMANMMAAINESALTDKQQVLAMMKPNFSRLGIQQIGEPNQEVEFNPELHADPDGALKSGEHGVIWSVGYLTEVGADRVILRKAQLSRK